MAIQSGCESEAWGRACVTCEGGVAKGARRGATHAVEGLLDGGQRVRAEVEVVLDEEIIAAIRAHREQEGGQVPGLPPDLGARDVAVGRLVACVRALRVLPRPGAVVLGEDHRAANWGQRWVRGEAGACTDPGCGDCRVASMRSKPGCAPGRWFITTTRTRPCSRCDGSVGNWRKIDFSVRDRGSPGRGTVGTPITSQGALLGASVNGAAGGEGGANSFSTARCWNALRASSSCWRIVSTLDSSESRRWLALRIARKAMPSCGVLGTASEPAAAAGGDTPASSVDMC